MHKADLMAKDRNNNLIKVSLGKTLKEVPTSITKHFGLNNEDSGDFGLNNVYHKFKVQLCNYTIMP